MARSYVASKRVLIVTASSLMLAGAVQAQPSLAQVTQRTLEHLDALDNLTAVQRMGDGSTYNVLMLAGEQWYRQGKKYRIALPRGKRGLFLGSEWYPMLKESLTWPLRGENGHYTFKSTVCIFGEIHDGKQRNQFYPCYGSVTTDARGNVQSITKTIEPGTKLTEMATFTIDYKWQRLSTWRLVPASLTANAKLSIGWYNVTAQWTDYQEYRATEPEVKRDRQPGKRRLT